MREYEEYQQILALWELGIAKKRIAITLDIPRATVRDCIERYGSLNGLEENRERASRSTPDETLSSICDPQNKVIQEAYAYLLGMYLGDGNITKVRNVYRIRVTLDARYPGIIQSCSEAIQIVLPDNQVGIVERFYRDRLSCVDVSCFHKFWPDIFPQHGKGSKHTREIKLQDWQQSIVDRHPLEFFRGLYHSDGSRFSNIVNGKDYPRYQFTNISDDIRQMFCATCDLLNLHWTEKALRGKSTDIFISKRADVSFLDQHIGPKA
jgi:hypothetical protein